MSGNKQRSGGRRTTALLAALAAVLVVSIIAYPDQAFAASLQGLTVWWNYVFPALLPFLILSELLLGFGFVHGLGALLEPLMRCLLRIPGAGGWALAVGGTIGLPAGARATSILYDKGLLTRSEAERLLAVSHLSSPVFIVTVVGTGFLHSSKLGLALAVIHATAALAVGVTLRLSANKQTKYDRQFSSAAADTERRSVLSRAYEALYRAHIEDGRPFGKLLGDSVASAVQTLMMVGGYMIIFSVIVQIIEVTQVMRLLQAATQFILHNNSFAGTIRSAVSGLLEVHIGSYAVSEQSGLVGAPLAAAVAALLGWGGLSSHAQAKSLTHEAQLRYGPFFRARLLHAGYSYIMTMFAWKPLSGWLDAAPSFSERGSSAAQHSETTLAAFPQPLAALVLLVLLLGVMLGGSMLVRALRSGRSIL